VFHFESLVHVEQPHQLVELHARLGFLGIVLGLLNQRSLNFWLYARLGFLGIGGVLLNQRSLNFWLYARLGFLGIGGVLLIQRSLNFGLRARHLILALVVMPR
jgi:hypothetical protein